MPGRIPRSLLLILITATTTCLAQPTNARLQIGSKQIDMRLQEHMHVIRTVKDTLLYCKSKKFKPFSMGSNTHPALIPVTDVKLYKREVFNAHGCVWSSVTTDYIPENEKTVTKVTYLNDSTNYIQLPTECSRHDTVMRIDPVTLEEEIYIEIDTVKITKFHLGQISRSQLLQSFANKFVPSGSNTPLRVEYVWFQILNEPCDELHINYKKPETMIAAKPVIETIPNGSTLIIQQLQFENANGLTFYLSDYDLAAFTLTD